MAYAFFPLYRFLNRKLKKPSLNAFIICFLALILLVLPGFLFLNGLVKESYSLYLLTKQKLATGLFQNCDNYFCQVIEDFGQNPNVEFRVQELFKTVTNWVVSRGSSLLISLPRMVLNVFVTFFAMFYFLKDGEKFLAHLNTLMGMKERKYAFIIHRLKQIVHGVVFGYLLVAFIQGSLGALGFWIFGIPSPLFWGMVMAFLALIPYLGTGVIWGPAAIFLFLDGVFQDSNTIMLKGVLLFLYGLIIVSGLDNLIKPKIVGDRARVHPIIIILGTLGGLFMFGPLGVLVGPLILSLTLLLLDTHLENTP
jgi:predicted PurR-regulated permease PerM